MDLGKFMRTGFTLALVSLVAVSCGGSRKMQTPDTVPAPTTPDPASRMNEDFDPSTLQEPPIPILPRERSGKKQQESSRDAGGQDAAAAQALIGYRIQVLQTEDAQEARETRKEAILLLDIDAYLSYDNPYYKVRVGDFRTRFEAEDFLNSVQENGYPSAWIVRTQIEPEGKSSSPPDPGPGN